MIAGKRIPWLPGQPCPSCDGGKVVMGYPCRRCMPEPKPRGRGGRIGKPVPRPRARVVQTLEVDK